MPDACLCMVGKTVKVSGVNDTEAVEVPLAKLRVSSPMVNGEVIVAVTPPTFRIPNQAVPYLLGNDYGPRMS